MNASAGGVEIALGLGSNIGDRRAHLAGALAVIGAAGIARDLRRSSIYRTAPWGPVAQDDYLNACATGITDLSPHDLLRRIKAAEVALGRTDTVRWGPRVIDIDILYYGDVSLDTPPLTLPHRDLLNRAFVLVPLAELRPDRTVSGLTIAEGAGRVDRSGVFRLEEDSPDDDPTR